MANDRQLFYPCESFALCIFSFFSHNLAVFSLSNASFAQSEGKEVDTAFNFVADQFHRSYEAKIQSLQS